MSVLFRKGPLKARLQGILKSTYQHAKALGSFVFIYKSVLYILKLLRESSVASSSASKSKSRTILNQIKSKSNPMDAFWAGLVGGYFVFGRNSPSAAGNSIAQQMVLYVFSRVILGSAKYFTENYFLVPKSTALPLTNTSWTVLASLSWAIVMYLFRAEPSALQHSMLHSMRFLYIDSETWSGLADFL